MGYFYPRSPCGERLAGPSGPAFLFNFYPRSPCGERPWQRGSRVTYVEISIHALLAESDSAKSSPEEAKRYFYPRSPCGERRIGLVFLWWGVRFLSTLSLRRATAALHNILELFPISIHALLAESDSKSAQNSGALLRI